ncbi:GNAT family N-acetyltransferase [Phenylobacterium montanum]|nr:N-acetyltransferase [Caulobacter sp. S6]
MTRFPEAPDFMTVQSRIADSAADTPVIAPETPADLAAVSALIEAAFGPGRYAKAAERLRETNHVLHDLSFTAKARGAVVGCVRQWPIRIGGQPAVFLGPIAVDPAWRHHGLGGILVEQACAAAKDAGHDLIFLVGDMPFFGPHGFEVVKPGSVIMPGPVDPRRELARALKPGALDGLAGPVTPGW